MRCSTREQSDSGAGLEAQRTAIQAECERRGWQLVALHTDAGSSGKSMEHRPDLARALEALDRGEADTLVVAKLDRLSRSLIDLAALMERARAKGWGLCILDTDVDTTTANGELVANVMGSVAQWERRIIGERTKAALAAKRAQGVKLGRPRLPVDDTARQRIAELRADDLTWREVAAQLNAEGVPTGQGGRWHANTARRIHHA